MITGTFYDSPDRSYRASLIEVLSETDALVCRWPKVAATEIFSGDSPRLCRVKVVSAESDFDWDSLDSYAGYYIANP